METATPPASMPDKAPKWTLRWVSPGDCDIRCHGGVRSGSRVDLSTAELSDDERGALIELLADANIGDASYGAGSLVARQAAFIRASLQDFPPDKGRTRAGEDLLDEADAFACRGADYESPAAPASPAVESQAGAEIGDEELRLLIDQATSIDPPGADHELRARLELIEPALSPMERFYIYGVVVERKRNRSALQVARDEANYLRRQLHELQADAWPLSRQLHDKAAAPAASPAGGGVAGLVSDLRARLLARLPTRSKAIASRHRPTVELFESDIALVERARTFVDHAPALAEALRPFAEFAAKFDAQPLRNIGDEVYEIHRGSEWEAALRLSDMRKAGKLLRAYDAATSTARPATDSLSGEGGGQ